MYKLYSQRQKASTPVGALEYEHIPQTFIQQYLYIARDFFATLPHPFGERHRYWEALCEVYCREKGIPLIGEESGEYALELESFLKTPSTSAEDILDIIELSFSGEVIPLFYQSVFGRGPNLANPCEYDAWQCIPSNRLKYTEELNQRFMQHNLGYELVGEQIIRKDSELLSHEIVEPAFSLLRDRRFASAEIEIQRAFRFRRAGDNAEAILNAAKSFESVMKVICAEMGYQYDAKHDNAKNLMQHLEKNAFYPMELNSSMAGLRTLLEGLPTIRNKKSGHGAGTMPTEIPDVLADYALHLAATNIVFLVDLLNQKETP